VEFEGKGAMPDREDVSVCVGTLDRIIGELANGYGAATVAAALVEVVGCSSCVVDGVSRGMSIRTLLGRIARGNQDFRLMDHPVRYIGGRAEERLRLADAVYRSTQEGIVVTDLDGVIVAANPALSNITEYCELELLGSHVRLLQSGRHNRDFYQNMWKCIQSTGRWEGEIWDRRKSGEVFQQWLSISALEGESGQPSNYVGMFTDISRMHHATSHLEHLAYYDALTELPNRSLLDARLTHTIETARRAHTLCALILIDLDGFKTVNDTMGHQGGDELLQLVGKRLGEHLRETDTVARWGGDEFAVVLGGLSEARDATRITQLLIERLSAPFRLPNGNEIRVGGSGGIGLFPADGTDAAALVKKADAALYCAKAAGGGTYRLASEMT
jgi:diguanylate cyclase (GGDEF)-like protein/PAS domain S-box-containing protein